MQRFTLVAAFAAMGLAGWAGACSTFESSSDDGADSGAETNPPDTVVPANDAAPACVPSPIDVNAAEPTTCNGIGVDLTGNPDHCGFCNHKCPDGTCIGGACRVIDVAMNPLGHPVLTTDGTDLYVVVNSTADPPDSGQVGRYSPASNTYEVITPFDPKTKGARGIKVGGGKYFFVADSYGVLGGPLSGGLAATIVDSPDSITEIGLGNDDLYWVHYNGGVHRRPFDGGAETLLYMGPFQESVGGLRVDSNTLAFGVRDDGGAPFTVTLHVRKAGAPEQLVPNLLGVNATVMDADYIYLADTTGRVRRVAKNAPSTFEQVTSVPGPWLSPIGLAVDDEYIYLATNDGSTNGQFSIFKASKCGGTAHRLVTDTFVFMGLVAAGGYLYWTHANAIAKMSK